MRKAGKKDIIAVYETLHDTARWLMEKGVSQWEDLLYEEDGRNEVKRAISSGITYMVENSGGDLVAVFNLSSEQNDWDIDMWGKRHDLAYYLHKLAVTKAYHRKQIGRQVLQWIDDHIDLENVYVRLDCVADNSVLNEFYQRAGYTRVGQKGLEETEFALYEKGKGKGRLHPQ